MDSADTSSLPFRIESSDSNDRRTNSRFDTFASSSLRYSSDIRQCIRKSASGPCASVSGENSMIRAPFASTRSIGVVVKRTPCRAPAPHASEALELFRWERANLGGYTWRRRCDVLLEKITDGGNAGQRSALLLPYTTQIRSGISIEASKRAPAEKGRPDHGVRENAVMSSPADPMKMIPQILMPDQTAEAHADCACRRASGWRSITRITGTSSQPASRRRCPGGFPVDTGRYKPIMPSITATLFPAVAARTAIRGLPGSIQPSVVRLDACGQSLQTGIHEVRTTLERLHEIPRFS